jgi:hypothetical protein
MSSYVPASNKENTMPQDGNWQVEKQNFSQNFTGQNSDIS